MDVGHHSPWLLLKEKAFAKNERQIMLKLCALKCRVISKSKKEHLEVFRKNNVTVLKLFSAEEDKKSELTGFQKQLDNLKASADVIPSYVVSIRSDCNKDQVNINNKDINKFV